MKRDTCLSIKVRQFQSLFVPANSGLRHAFVEEALCQPRISLHQLWEGLAMLNDLADLLQFANSFVEQTHFPESNPQVVVSLRIFSGSGGGLIFLQLALQLVEHLGEV